MSAENAQGKSKASSKKGPRALPPPGTAVAEAEASPGTGKKKKAKKGDGDQPMEKREEIDPTTLERDKAISRLQKTYRLRKLVETKQAKFDLASRMRRAAEAELEEARAELDREIDEQRYGPGPLYNPAGDGPAKQSEKR